MSVQAAAEVAGEGLLMYRRVVGMAHFQPTRDAVAVVVAQGRWEIGLARRRSLL